MNQEDEFNRHGRVKNAGKAMTFNVVATIANRLMAFAYRLVFLHYLSAAYLGITGLFTNIILLLSFADLGIGTVLDYRLFQPISEKDTQKVGELMNFYRMVYRTIALAVLLIGMALYPFLGFFIKDAEEIPSDINLHLVYLLFLLKTLVSYGFVYKQILVSADQRRYMLSLLNAIMAFVLYCVQILILVFTGNYTLTLVAAVVIPLVFNYTVSLWIGSKYKSVFRVREVISKEERKDILTEAKAMLCHKVGGTVKTSTDNIVLSKFVGLIATGMYANYAMVISTLSELIVQMLGSFSATIGNARMELDRERRLAAYEKLLFANFWIASVCTVCLFHLINDFIRIWLGEGMVLDRLTVIALSIEFYISSLRVISTSYTNASGLFVRDKARPLIEAAINLAVSIVLAKQLGIAGVFFGTAISSLLTVIWREPYLLYKYEFCTSSRNYWTYFFSFTILTLLLTLGFGYINKVLPAAGGIIAWIIKGFLMFSICNLVLALLYLRDSNFRFYRSFFKQRLFSRNG